MWNCQYIKALNVTDLLNEPTQEMKSIDDVQDTIT